MRGLSVINQKVAWASGMKGTVIRTIDGEHWQDVSVAASDPQAATLDFRDIQGFDAMSAIAMSAGPGKASTLYKTTDGGVHWERLSVNSDETGFWDAIDFWDARHGAVLGDPVDGQFKIMLTEDGGKSWAAAKLKPSSDGKSGLEAQANEGAFAASGTCLIVQGKKVIRFVSGSAEHSRAFYSNDRGQTWASSVTPVTAGAPPKGLFSIAFADAKHGLAVGGDYQQAKGEGLNAVRTDDGGKTWTSAAALPKGFLSVVVNIPGQGKMYVAGGLAGLGLTRDQGKTWQVMSEIPVNSVAFADTKIAWAVGPKGLLLRYLGPDLRKLK